MRRAALTGLAGIGLTVVLAACGYQGTHSAAPSNVQDQPAATGGGTTTPSTSGSQGGTTTPAPAGQGDPAAGKTVFTSSGCSGCHTLKDAGATGQVGPSLDAKKPAYAIVVAFVTNGGGPMPAFGTTGTLSSTQIADVAAYVSSVAGK